MKAILRSINNFSCKLKQSNNLKYNISPKIRSNKYKSISGNGNVVIEDALNKNLKDYRVYGNTYQNSTSGKNLLDDKNMTARLRCTVDNGVITTTPLARADTFYVNINDIPLKAGDELYTTFKVRLKSGTASILNYGGRLYNGTTYATNTRITNNRVSNEFVIYSAKQTVSTDIIANQMVFQTENTANVSDAVYEIKDIIVSTNPIDTYEEYTGGQPSPNPDYPQEIVSVGENKTGLPVGYTQVDYIESSGTQYIDTGFKPNGDTVIMSKNTFNTNSLFGVTDDNQNKSFIVSGGSGAYKSDYVRNFSAGGLRIEYDFHTDRTTPYELYVDKNKAIATINGVTYILNYEHTTYNLSNNMYIFARNEIGTATLFTSRKLYYFKIYDGNTLARDFIPCYRNSDNEVGLYDLVNDVFYTNQGTGVFTYGSEIEKGGYKIPVNVRSENLLKVIANSSNGITSIINSDGSITYSGTATSTWANITASNYIDIEPGEYTFSIDKPLDYKIIIRLYYEDNTYDYAEIYATNTTRRFTLNKKVKRYYVYISNYLTVGKEYNETLYIQLIKGTTVPTKFQPYYNETTNIYLDEPLRKTGDYSDYIDFINGKVVRNIKEYTLIGDEQIKMIRGGMNCIKIDGKNIRTESLTMPPIFCNMLLANSRDSIYQGNVGIGYGAINNEYYNDIVMRVPNITTLTDFTTWLQSNNVTVDYVLAIPAEEDIELPNINLIEGKNIITIGTELESVIEVEYYSKEIIDISDYKYNLRKVED